MFRQRTHLIVAVGMTLCMLAGSAPGKPVSVHKHHGRGRGITRYHRPSVPARPVIRRPALAVRPYHRPIHGRSLFHRIMPKRHHHHLVVIRTPYGRIIKAYPGHRVNSHYGYVERMIVRIWFTNSNGTRTGVELVRRGPGYVGPRGEWYHEMPTRRHLRIAYGF